METHPNPPDSSQDVAANAKKAGMVVMGPPLDPLPRPKATGLKVLEEIIRPLPDDTSGH